MRQIWAAVLLAVLLLTGCTKHAEVTLVSKISVDWEPDGSIADRIYQDSEKMHRVLNRLRQLGQTYSPEVPPPHSETVTVTLLLTDGSSHCHQFMGDCYLRTDGGPWQQTDPEQLQKLKFILKALPGDG